MFSNVPVANLALANAIHRQVVMDSPVAHAAGAPTSVPVPLVVLPPESIEDEALIPKLVSCIAAVLREDLVGATCPGGSKDPLHRHYLTEVMRAGQALCSTDMEDLLVQALPPDLPRNVYMFAAASRFALFPHTPAGRVVWRLVDSAKAWGQALFRTHGKTRLTAEFHKFRQAIQDAVVTPPRRPEHPVTDALSLKANLVFQGDIAMWLAHMIVLRVFDAVINAPEASMAAVLASAPGVAASRDASIFDLPPRPNDLRLLHVSSFQQVLLPALLWDLVPMDMRQHTKFWREFLALIGKVQAHVMKGAPESAPGRAQILEAAASQLVRCNQFYMFDDATSLSKELQQPTELLLQYMVSVDREPDPAETPRPQEQVALAQGLRVAHFGVMQQTGNDWKAAFQAFTEELKPSAQQVWGEQMVLLFMELMLIAPRTRLRCMSQLSALAWAVFTQQLPALPGSMARTCRARHQQLFTLYYFHYNRAFGLRGRVSIEAWVAVEEGIIAAADMSDRTFPIIQARLATFHMNINHCVRPMGLQAFHAKFGGPGPDLKQLLLHPLPRMPPMQIFALADLCFASLRRCNAAGWLRLLDAFCEKVLGEATTQAAVEVLAPCRRRIQAVLIEGPAPKQVVTTVDVAATTTIATITPAAITTTTAPGIPSLPLTQPTSSFQSAEGTAPAASVAPDVFSEQSHLSLPESSPTAKSSKRLDAFESEQPASPKRQRIGAPPAAVARFMCGMHV